jgi:hypothetical protein
MTAHRLELLVLEGRPAVCKQDPAGDPPLWATNGDSFSITRSHDEISVVCPETSVPAEVRAEKGWRISSLPP